MTSSHLKQFDDEEKLYYLIMLMRDMRDDSSSNISDRVFKIKTTAENLGAIQTICLVEKYEKYTEKSADYDGKFFRVLWKNGGYLHAPIPNIMINEHLFEIICKDFNRPWNVFNIYFNNKFCEHRKIFSVG